MTGVTGNTVRLNLAAAAYLRWLLVSHLENDHKEEAAFEDLQAYKLELVAEMLEDLPHVSLQYAEAYINGMLDGYLEGRSNV